MTQPYPEPPYPSRKQPMPGSTREMDPRPDHGEESYKGSGKLTGRKAVITGGDSGIGRAVAIAFAREGADVLIAYLNENDDAQEVKALVEKEGRQAVLVAGDLSDPEHCRVIIRRAVEAFGGIDILVNNAAHQADVQGDRRHQRRGVANDLRGQHSRHVLPDQGRCPPHEAGRRGHQHRSVNSDMPNPMLLAYATTKGAIQNFTGGLAQMLAGQGHPRQRRRAGPDLDAAHSLDDAGGGGQDLRQTDAVRARRTARGTRHRLRHARRSPFELHVRNDGRESRAASRSSDRSSAIPNIWPAAKRRRFEHVDG